MDYMLELAGHPDIPEALDRLTTRHASPAASLPAAARTGDLLQALNTLADCRKQHLAEDHPNAWLVELVHQFYAVPQLAADVWTELRYCRQFRHELAVKTTDAHQTAVDARTAQQRALVAAMDDCRKGGKAGHIRPDVFEGAPALAIFELALKKDESTPLIDALSYDAGLCPPIPPFINRLVDRILEKRIEAGPQASVADDVLQQFDAVKNDVLQGIPSLKKDGRVRPPNEILVDVKKGLRAVQAASAERSAKKRVRNAEIAIETRVGPMLARSNEVRWLLAHPDDVVDVARDLAIPVPFTLVLDAELRQIRATRQLNGSREQADGDDTRMLSPHRKAFSDHLVGLAFSGGGIRSATFNLGVLQSLASIGVLQQCDYLSTVSGGGYIGGWFSAWVHRTVRAKQDVSPGKAVENARSGLEEIYRRLSPFRLSDPLDARVRPIRYLREFSNYLTPRTGFLSGDTWTMVGIYVRNALLNQVILASLFAALLLVPRVAIKLWRGPDGALSVLTDFVPLLIASLCGVAGTFLVKNLRRLDPRRSESRVEPASAATTPAEKATPWYATPVCIQALVIVPWLLATSLAAHHFVRTGMRINAGGWWLGSLLYAGGHDRRPVGVALLAMIYIGAILGCGGVLRCWREDDGTFRKGQRARGTSIIVLAAFACGSVAGGLAWLVIWLFHYLPWESGESVPWHAVALGTPALLGVLSLVIVVQLGMLGEDFPDEHREWWSRLRSYIHMYAIGWLVWFVTAVYVPWGFHGLQEVHWSRSTGAGAVAAWIISTLFGVRGSNSTAAASPAAGPSALPRSMSATLLRWFSAIAPYVFVAGLMIGLSLTIDAVYHANIDGDASAVRYWTFATRTTEDWSAPALIVGFGLVCALFSWRVDINEFSMYHFYKNRLVRCYLGASRADERKADWFTGFDPRDDIRLAEFDHNSKVSDETRLKLQYPGPYPIVNAALNLVGGKDLAWQERKAESFVFTPKYCGYDLDRATFKKAKDLATEAYIPTQGFYRPGSGPLLGMAMAISGAAANPNMGRATSPASAFLMTAFNVRLGWWIGNPRNKVKAEVPGPRSGLVYTMSELTGSTNDESDFVNLSDGGHFDNLGVYELVRRGCRYIIACDAGQDGKVIGEDLGDLVRRCRTDFNVDIDISIERIHNRTPGGLSHAHCVVGRIHYLNVPRRNSKGVLVNDDNRPLAEGERPAHEIGYLVYLKPSITGDEPHDIIEYQALSDAFPHETTADQWFGESQFEAYRKLGMHVAEQTFARYQTDSAKPIRDVGLLFERLYRFWYPPALTIAGHSTQHTKTYSEIMERVRQAAGLAALDHTAFDGLPPDIARALKPRDEFYVCSSLIQLMEDVYADLDLEQNWDHPHVEGWMSVFRRWVLQTSFKTTWASSSATYAERFRHFYADRLLASKPRRLIFRDNFIVAHRGLWKGTPADQNTLKAFRAAASATRKDKPDAVELDVQRLKGGELVVFHDDTIDDKPLTALTLLDFTEATNGQVLTFSDCLDDLRSRSIRLDIEIKTNGAAADVLRALRDAAWSPENFVVTSFDEETLKQVRAIRAEIQTGLLIKGALTLELIKKLGKLDVDFVGPDVASLYNGGTLQQWVLTECAKAGVSLVPWVENDGGRIRDLLDDPAVVGVITDRADLAVKARRELS